MNDRMTLEELIADYERPFDLEYFDDKYMMFADAKDKLKPLVDALRARIADLDAENNALRLELQRYRDRRLPAARTETNE